MKDPMLSNEVRSPDGVRRKRRRRKHRPGRAARPAAPTPDELVERHLGLAEHLAHRFRHTSEPLDDLVQVARLGLVNAAQRWNPDRGVAFSTFAVPTILGELRRYFRDRAWLVRPPRDLQELYLAVQRCRDQLWQELGREPNAKDVATRLERPVEDILDALAAADAYRPGSLDAPIRDEQLDGASGQDLLSDDRRDLEDGENRVAIEQLAAVLSARDREVIRLRFSEDLIQREIAERVGCSQMHVSRILRDAVRRMQQAADTP
jgi:RNA polymerase sigma-B factor